MQKESEKLEVEVGTVKRRPECAVGHTEEASGLDGTAPWSLCNRLFVIQICLLGTRAECDSALCHIPKDPSYRSIEEKQECFY